LTAQTKESGRAEFGQFIDFFARELKPRLQAFAHAA
jgi:hypothetical protein